MNKFITTILALIVISGTQVTAHQTYKYFKGRVFTVDFLNGESVRFITKIRPKGNKPDLIKLTSIYFAKKDGKGVKIPDKAFADLAFNNLDQCYVEYIDNPQNWVLSVPVEAPGHLKKGNSIFMVRYRFRDNQYVDRSLIRIAPSYLGIGKSWPDAE